MMATTTEGGIDQQLLNELRKRYPEVPEYVVTCQMIKHKNDRSKCIEVLDNETPNYLYEGNQTQKTCFSDIQNRIDNMTISQAEARQRSDSASSNVSSTSTCSVSSASSAQHGSSNTISAQIDSRPSHLENQDFSQFVTGRPTNIPNINCEVYSSNSKQGNYTSSSQGGLRPIQVIHFQTDRSKQGQMAPSVVGEQSGRVAPSVVGEQPGRVLIQVSPRQPANHQPDQYVSSQTSPHYQHQQSYPPSNRHYNHGGYNSNNYSPSTSYMNTGPTSLDRYSLRGNVPVTLTHGQPPPLPPSSTSHGGPVSFSNQFSSPSLPVSTQYGGNQAGSSSNQSHSSQAVIFLRTNSNTADQNKTGGYSSNNTISNNSNLPYSQYPPSTNTPGSQNDLYPLSSHGNYNQAKPPTLPQHQAGGSSTSNYNTPLYIRLSSNQASDGSPYRYVTSGNDPANPNIGGSGLNSVNSRYGAGPQGGGGHMNPTNPPSTNYIPVYFTDVHSTAGGGVGYSSQEGSVNKHYPQMPTPSYQSGHSPVPPPPPARTGSVDPDHGYINPEPFETRHISQATFPPMVSPASSHSSLSSDSAASQRENHRPRSGSQQEEADYLQALLTFQKERMSKLKLDLETELRNLSKVRAEVNQMEKNMLDRQRSRNHNSSPRLEDVARIRDNSMKLQAEIQVMTREIDMYNNGQTPLGVLDPLEQQNFFQNMNPGQRGSIYSRPVPTPSRESPPPIPPRIHQVPPAPPPQPSTGSGDSDGDGEQWSCSACTFLNHPALNKCECCEMPRMNVQVPATGPIYHHINLGEQYEDVSHTPVSQSDSSHDFELV